MKTLVLYSLFLLLSACSVYSPIKTEPTAYYVINSLPNMMSQKNAKRINLLVTKPEANTIYNTVEIAYSTRPYQIAYFVKNRWAETPTQMLQPLIIAALQKTQYFNNLSANGTATQYDFILNTQLVELQQDYSHTPYRVHLVMRAEIIKTGSQQLVAIKDFAIAVPIQRNTPYGGVIATNKATALLLEQLTHFCLQNMKPRKINHYK